MATKKKAKKPSKYVTLKLTHDEAQRLYNMTTSIFMPRHNGDAKFIGLSSLPNEVAQERTIDHVIIEKLGAQGFSFRDP